MHLITEKTNSNPSIKTQKVSSLFTQWQSELIFYAYYYLQEEDASQDIVQDVFLRLLELGEERLTMNLPVDENQMLYLLKAITKNKCLDYLKIKKNRLRLLKNWWQKQPEKTEMPESFTKDLLELLTKKLPYRELQVLKLSIEGYKNEEIAQELGISYNTVRNTLYEARKKAKYYWDIFNR